MDQNPQFPQNTTTISALVLKRFPGSDKPDAPPGLKFRASQYRLELESTVKRLTAPTRDPLEDTPAADFEYHAKLSYWTVDEAVALSMGRVPFQGGWKYVASVRSTSNIACDFGWRREIVERARIMGQLWDQTIPAVFVAWAKRMKFPLPDGLVAGVEQLGEQVVDWKTAHDWKDRELTETREKIQRLRAEHLEAIEKNVDSYKEMSDRWGKVAHDKQEMIDQLVPEVARLRKENAEFAKAKAVPSAQKSELSARERQTLLKIIIGQAVKNYGFEPKRARNGAAGEIASDLTTVGISVSEDTIRNYLNEAKEIVDLPDLG